MVVALAIFLLVPFAADAAEGWTAETGAIVYGVATNADGSLVVAGRRDNTIVAYDYKLSTGASRSDAPSQKCARLVNRFVYE